MRALHRALPGAPTAALLLALAGLLSGCVAAAPTTDGAEAIVAPGSSADLAEEDSDGGEVAETEELRVTTGPDENSAVRSVVDGFPLDLLPLPDDAMVLVTSAVQVGEAEVQEVSLNLRTQDTAAAVLALYRTSLVDAGFVEVVPETLHADLAVETLFTRSGGDELLSIGILDDGAGRTVTIGGRIRTEG